jgi:hypothetical protein
MPLICYTPKRFTRDSREVIDYANRIIADYDEQGLSLTLRQLYYRFVAADLLPNSNRSYKRLGSIINDARLAGLLDWDAIEDRGRELHGGGGWENPSQLLGAMARGYSRDSWEGQPERVEIWVEKQALEDVIGQAAHERGCAYFACKGYTSQSEMWRAARRFARYIRNGQQPIIIHLGDHDPSGIDMTRDITERINDVFGVRVEVIRIALNWDQIEQYQPPPNPAKMDDSRFAAYAERFGDESWELDALEPRTMRDLIVETIDEHLDREIYDAVLEREADERRTLEMLAENWETSTWMDTVPFDVLTRAVGPDRDELSLGEVRRDSLIQASVRGIQAHEQRLVELADKQRRRLIKTTGKKKSKTKPKRS